MVFELLTSEPEFLLRSCEPKKLRTTGLDDALTGLILELFEVGFKKLKVSVKFYDLSTIAVMFF